MVGVVIIFGLFFGVMEERIAGKFRFDFDTTTFDFLLLETIINIVDR